MKVAVLEDDTALLSNVLLPGLAPLGLDVEGFSLAKDFYRRMLTQTFDALVLDIALPDEDGRQIARYLHTHHPEIAIVALTGLHLPHGHSTRLLVDVWLTKPIDIEMLAVVLADLARRKQAKAKDPGANAGEKWRFDPADWKLYAPDGRGLMLNLRERVIVKRLLAASGEAVPREELIAALNENGYDMDSNGLDVLIHRLRRKVSSALNVPLPLQAARGRGYALLAAVDTLPVKSKIG